jgi:chromosome segregation ATPase
MDVKTQPLDRLLEVISPALAAELERVAQETREQVEQEFQSRVQEAVREAEAAAVSAAREDHDRAMEQAKEEMRRQVTAELEQQLKEAAEQRAKVEAAMAEMKEEWSVELNKLEDERVKWRTLAEAQQQLAEASSQMEMLDRFLNLGQPFAQGLAVYVTKADGLALWKSRGKGAFSKIVSRETTDPDSYFRALSVRGKTVGAVCAAPSFQSDILDFLGGSLERAIEAFGLKLHTPVPK